VRLAGGLPVLLPPGEPDPAAILKFVDGLIFSDGGDLDPLTYSGPAHPAVRMAGSKRDAFELTLARFALKASIPVLGICRGLGVLSVVSGGSLVTHIPDEFGEVVAHSAGATQTVEHPVEIELHSQLAKAIGATQVTVVSGHHQAVRTAPLGWHVAAHAADGVIEAIWYVPIANPWSYLKTGIAGESSATVVRIVVNSLWRILGEPCKFYKPLNDFKISKSNEYGTAP